MPQQDTSAWTPVQPKTPQASPESAWTPVAAPQAPAKGPSLLGEVTEPLSQHFGFRSATDVVNDNLGDWRQKGGLKGMAADVAGLGAGAVDFLQSPLGIGATTAEVLSEGAATPYLAGGFAGSELAQTPGAVYKAYQHPTPENVQGALLHPGMAALMAHGAVSSWKPVHSQNATTTGAEGVAGVNPARPRVQVGPKQSRDYAEGSTKPATRAGESLPQQSNVPAGRAPVAPHIEQNPRPGRGTGTAKAPMADEVAAYAGPERRETISPAPGGVERRTYTPEELQNVWQKVKPAAAQDNPLFDRTRANVEQKWAQAGKPEGQAPMSEISERQAKSEAQKAATLEKTQPTPSTTPTAPTPAESVAKEPVRPADTKSKPPQGKRTLEQAREISQGEEPKIKKGMSTEEKRGVAKQRNEWLASRAQIAREEGTPGKTEGPHPLHGVLDRTLKTPGRGEELAKSVESIEEKDRPRLATEMRQRAEGAEATLKEVERLEKAKDFDKALSSKLKEREPGPIGKNVYGKATERATYPRIVRQHPNELTGVWNRLRGREMKRVPGKDMPDFSKDPEIAAKVKGWEAELDGHLDAIRGGADVAEHEEAASKVLANIQAATGKYDIAGKFKKPGVGPSGEPTAPGSAMTGAWYRKVMGQPDTGHTTKPTPEAFEARKAHLSKEAKYARALSEHLGEAPEAPVEAPRKPQEPSKSAPAPMAQTEAEGLRSRQMEQLSEMRRHLKNVENTGRNEDFADKLRKGIARLERETGAEHEKTAGEVLKEAPVEAKPKPKVDIGVEQKESLEVKGSDVYGTSANSLHEYLEGHDLEVPEKHAKTQANARDFIARPIMEAVKSGELEPIDVQKRYGRALDIYNEGLKRKSPEALAKALEYAKTGKVTPTKVKPSEAGAVAVRGVTRPAPTVRTIGRTIKNWVRTGIERNNEAKRIYDGLMDLKQAGKGDVLRYQQVADATKGNKFYRTMDDCINEQLLPANQRTITPTPETVQRYNHEIKPMVEDTTRIRNKLKTGGVDITDITGMTHRVPLKKGQAVEKMLQGKMRVTAGNVLSTFASVRKGAKYQALTDPETGTRLTVRIAKSGQVHMFSQGHDLGSIGAMGDLKNAGFQFGRATTNEVQTASGRAYFKHAWINNAIENIAARRAERIYDHMEQLKRDPRFKALSTSNADVARERGFRPVEVKGRRDIPQLKGYYFEPHIAEVLEREWNRSAKGYDKFERLNEGLKRSIFWNPLLHVPNIGIHWLGEKGLSGQMRLLFRPSEYRALGRTLDVMSDPQKYAQMLDAGVPLMRAPNTSDVTHLFVTKATKDISGPIGNRLAKAFGYPNKLGLLKALYHGASEITWGSHDMAILQSTFARMEQHGWSLEEASKEVTKHIPNYQMPPRVWNSRVLGKLMDTPGISMFSRYHYGAFKSYGEMVKELVKPLKPGDRARAIDRMAALGFMTYVIYPQLDKIAKAATGDTKAMMRRAGSSTFVYNLGKVMSGKMGLVPFAESVVTPSPVLGAAFRAVKSSDLNRSGVPLGKQLKALGKVGLESVGPVTGYESGQERPGEGKFNWKRFLFKLIGGRYETQPRSRGLRMPSINKRPQ